MDLVTVGGAVLGVAVIGFILYKVVKNSKSVEGERVSGRTKPTLDEVNKKL